MKIILGKIIATRKFFLNNKEIHLSIGMPKKFSDSDDYYCPYIFKGIGSEEIKFAGGVDSLQALQLCIKAISYEFNYLDKEVKSKITWEAGSKEGDLGLLNYK